MKTHLENPLNLGLINSDLWKEFFAEFNEITIAINIAKDSLQLRKFMPKKPKYFEYGFGGSHIWVKQNGNPNRIMFAEFV